VEGLAFGLNPRERVEVFSWQPFAAPAPDSTGGDWDLARISNPHFPLHQRIGDTSKDIYSEIDCLKEYNRVFDGNQAKLLLKFNQANFSCIPPAFCIHWGKIGRICKEV